MKKFLSLVAVLVGLMSAVVHAADAPAATVAAAAAMEKQVTEIVAGPQVTIVHFWAPWCPNCRAEMSPDGWAKFIAANPDVKFVFLNVWHRGQDPQPKLAAGNLGAQPNLTLLTHPIADSKGDLQLKNFLGLPVTWLPTTWVFREGKMRYALNYGEIRFDMLQQLVTDTQDKWKH